MALPTKRIPALPPAVTPLSGDEQLEAVQIGASVKLTARDFVLPTDSLITVSGMAGALPGSRQLVNSATIQIVDNGPGGTISLNALLTGALPGNPTALVGLTPINGVAATWMRSDAAPALDQAIAPDWSGIHTFSGSETRLRRNGTTRLLWETPNAAADQKLWEIRSDSVGSFSFLTRTDLDGAGTTWASATRTGTAVNSFTVNTQLIANSTAATGSLQANSSAPSLGLFETDASAGNRLWRIRANAEGLQFGVFDDTASAGTNWLTVERTLNVVDSINLASTALTWNGSPISTAVGANPTAQVGTAAVNGVATTYMRSDGAPAINQSMAPTWSGLHTFQAATGWSLSRNSNARGMWNVLDAPVDEKIWEWRADNAGAFSGRTRTDADGAGTTWIAVDRTGTTVDSIALNSSALTWNGNPISVAVGANPTASVGLAAVNGVATTFMRSDAAPALSQTIAPTWTGVHSFTASRTVFGPTPFTPAVVDGVVVISSNQPNLFMYEADGAADNRLWRFVASGEDLIFQVRNDADSTGNSWLLVNRTGVTIDTITLGATRIDLTRPGGGGAFDFFLNDQASAANERLWRMRANAAGQLQWGAVNDALSVANNFMLVDRTGATVDSVSFPTATTASFLVGASSAITAMAIFAGAADVLAAVSTNTANYPIKVWSNANSGDNGFILFITEGGGVTRGAVVYNRGAGLTAYNTTSDARRKTNIVDSPDASGLIDQIKVRSFDWKESGIHVDHWFVAQELYDVAPLAVSVGDENRDWAVDPAKLVPLLVKELQSVRRRLAAVEGTIH